MKLAQRLAEVLEEGGPRKPAILKALAHHHGHTDQDFDQAIAELRAAHRLKTLHRNGGPHYAIRPAT